RKNFPCLSTHLKSETPPTSLASLRLPCPLGRLQSSRYYFRSVQSARGWTGRRLSAALPLEFFHAPRSLDSDGQATRSQRRGASRVALRSGDRSDALRRARRLQSCRHVARAVS